MTFDTFKSEFEKGILKWLRVFRCFRLKKRRFSNFGDVL